MWNKRVVTEKCNAAGLTVDEAGQRSGIRDLQGQLDRTIPYHDDSTALGRTLGVPEYVLTTADPENWVQVSPTEWELAPGQ